MRRAGLRYSLPALRAFETVARAGSLTEAAKELGLSVSAVSFHLRELQLALGAELVRRSGRGVALTEDGVVLARGLSRGFGALDAAVEAFAKRRVGARVVDVSVLPLFATRWLIPRISAFQRAHPGVEVRVTTTERRVDLDREGYDCAVRCGPGDWPGVRSARLFPQRLAPVCNRLYAQEAGLPGKPADLAAHRLISNELRADEWARWLEAAGAPPLRLAASQTYDSREAVLQAVLSGAGVGLADRSLLASELAGGELIAPLDIDIPTGWSSYLVWPQDREETDAAALFRAWLLDAAGSSEAADGDPLVSEQGAGAAWPAPRRLCERNVRAWRGAAMLGRASRSAPDLGADVRKVGSHAAARRAKVKSGRPPRGRVHGVRREAADMITLGKVRPPGPKATSEAEPSRRTILTMGAAGALASCGTVRNTTASAASEPAQPSPRRDAGIAEYLTGLEGYGFAGALLAARGSQVVHLSSHGLADRGAGSVWSPETRFDTGSVTKQFTAAAVLALVADGALSTSDPIGRHLTGAPADKRAITIHQLLTHGAGIDGGSGGDYDRVSRDEFLQLVYGSKLTFPPGTAHAYSNPGYGVLAAIIEIVSGRSIDEFMGARLFRPLGMSATGYGLPAERQIARGYSEGTPRDFVERTRAAEGQVWRLIGNGGLHSTINDLHRWNEALSGDRLFPGSIRDKLFEPHVMVRPNHRGSGTPLYYGYGWYVWPEAPGGRLVWHLGGNGTLNCAIRRHVGAGFSVLYASNVSEFSDPAYPVPAVERMLAGERIAPPPPLAGAPESALALLEGGYVGPAGSSLVVRSRGDRLDVSGEGQAAFNFIRTGRWIDDPALARLNELTLRVFQGSRDRRFAELLAFYPETNSLEGLAAFESAFWDKREKAYGKFRRLWVAGSRTGSGASVGHTIAAAEFERGTAWRQYSWSAEGRLTDINAIDDGPTLRLFLTSDGDLVSFDAAAAKAIRVAVERGPDHIGLSIPQEAGDPVRLQRR